MYDGIRIRVDVMERLANGTWGLREVKSTARPKDNTMTMSPFNSTFSTEAASLSHQSNSFM
jgi:hypothetical protein